MTTQEKPVIVLLHGAWHIPLHYRALIDRLRVSGYTVFAPYQVTTGYDDSINDKTYVDSTNQIRDYLRPLLGQGRKIVIVAHSAGGIVATGAAIGSTLEDRSSQGLQGGIVGIVYISALIEPQHGRTDKPMPFPPGWTDYKKRPFPEDLALMLLYDDIEESRQKGALQMLHLQSEATCDPDRPQTASDVRAPKTYVVCTKDKIVPPEKQYQRAAAAGATIVELDCGHSPFLLDKETEVLLDVITKVANV
ncbi:alpha/beta-hydrolase [Rostrohypoxylon terebratum]|nr:alpha/beta-hydrolase [Rostrohypoxylon terebratum]